MDSFKLKKIIMISVAEIIILCASFALYFTLLDDFQYKILIIFPTFLIMANSAIAINAFYDRENVKRKQIQKNKEKRIKDLVKSANQK